MKILESEITKLAGEYRDKVLELTKELCTIPSPSGNEISKVRFIKVLLDKTYGGGAVIDEEDNLVYKMKGRNSEKCILISAHTDTVFPENTPLVIRQEGNRLYCPSILDNSINCAALFYGIGVLKDIGIMPEYDMIFAFNSGEEGTGNLRGIRKLVKTYGKSLLLVMSLDLGYQEVITRAVGSSRYRVTVKTEGGHSWFASDRVNSIAVLAQIISRIYEIPMGNNPKTTYNAGVISGGRSVNTVAPEASLLLDIRSENNQSLENLKSMIMSIIDEARGQDRTIEVTNIGDRPCGDGKVSPIVSNIINYVNKKFDMAPEEIAASTDANIPLSYGIPAFVTGVAVGENAHSMDEYIEQDSVEKGLEIFFTYLLEIGKGTFLP
ncbi:MAG TPA: M20/M25/M40 family metallo-hydrolase [Clostridiaceae bacterium]|nr:M20/M25/M40 family metallo-hydrolase [Clostridiaceae bacterium]